MNYVCGDCGTLNATMNQNCTACNSFRIVFLPMVKRVFGEDWKKCFDKAQQGEDQ